MAPKFVLLGDVSLETQYGTPEKANEDGVGVPVLRMGNITEEGAIDLSSLKHVKLSEPDFEKFTVRRGDILFNRTNSPALVGKTAVWKSDESYAYAGYLVRLRLDPLRCDPRFVSHILNTPRMKRELRAHAKPSINMSNLSASELLKFEVPLPALDQQERIADVLDRVEALRARRRAALALLDTMTQAVFLDLFGDPSLNPKGWPTKTFQDTMTDQTSSAPKLLASRYEAQGKFPVVDQGQEAIAGFCSDDDLLCPVPLPVIVFGDHTRIVKLVSRPFVVGADGAKVLVPKPEFEAHYLSELLRLLPIPKLGYSRHMREVKRLSFVCPPLDKQRAFARVLSAIDSTRARMLDSLMAVGDLLASLRTRAFSGTL